MEQFIFCFTFLLLLNYNISRQLLSLFCRLVILCKMLGVVITSVQVDTLEQFTLRIRQNGSQYFGCRPMTKGDLYFFVKFYILLW